MGLLPMDIDLLPPSDDRIFKLLLTSPEGKSALIDLISATIKRPVANIPEYREAVNKVIDSKEALQMAGNLLMGVSKDERERAVYRSRRMYQTDMQSNIATAEDRGIQIGEQRKAFAMARNMIADGEAVEKITRYTGLTCEEVESLYTTAR